MNEQAKQTRPRFVAYDVFVGEECAETLFYSAVFNMTAEDVRDSLINHDGYDPAITVKRRA